MGPKTNLVKLDTKIDTKRYETQFKYGPKLN